MSEDIKPTDGTDFAKAFHEAYERLAPDFGYITRIESARPWEDVPPLNRELMEAVVEEVVLPLLVERDEAQRERDKAIRDYMHGTQHWVDATCHYRNLAITLGATPDKMLDKYDADLAAKHQDDDFGGWDEELPSVWDELEAAERQRDEARHALSQCREDVAHWQNKVHELMQDKAPE